MNISFLLKYLWGKRWLILIPTVLAILLSWLFTRHETKSYTSEAEISTGYMEVNPLQDNRSANNTILFNNVIQTLQSRQVLDPVSYALLLHDLQSSSPFHRKTDDTMSATYPGGKVGLIRSLNNKLDSFYVLDLAREDDRMIHKLGDVYGYSSEDLRQKITIKRIEGSDFIQVTVTTSNPHLSAFLANAVTTKFLSFYQTRQGQASAISLDTLKSMMETKKQILDNQLKLLPTGTDISLSSSVGLVGTLQAQLSQQKSNLIAAQVALDNINKQLSAAGSQKGTGSNEDIIDLRNHIDALWSQYVGGGSNNPVLLDQINKLRGQLQQKMSAIGQSTSGTPVGDLLKQKMNSEIQVNVANQTINDLQRKIASINGTMESSASQQGIVTSMQNQIEIARQDYMSANKLYNDALNRNIFPGIEFKQTLIANPPLYPDPSKKLKVIGFSGVGVFFFITFLLLFFEFIDPSIKTPAFLKANITVPLLANLKYLNTKSPLTDELYRSDHPVSKSQQNFKDQVKQLRYEVERGGGKILLVMGYHKQSGRTTIVECLANSLSLSNRKVLLVDANFSNNTLTQKFNAKPSLENFDYKDGQIDIQAAISSIVTKTADKNINVIGCNSGNYTPSEALPNRNLFTQIKNDSAYDYVIIDCASLSSGPDGKELLKYSDAVILAFAADQTLTEDEKKLIDFLKTNDFNPLGAVLNKVPMYSTDL